MLETSNEIPKCITQLYTQTDAYSTSHIADISLSQCTQTMLFDMTIRQCTLYSTVTEMHSDWEAVWSHLTVTSYYQLEHNTRYVVWQRGHTARHPAHNARNTKRGHYDMTWSRRSATQGTVYVLAWAVSSRWHCHALCNHLRLWHNYHLTDYIIQARKSPRWS